MNLSERIWSRVSKDRVVPKANELIGHHTEVGALVAEKGVPPKGSTRDDPPTGRGHLTQGKDT